jgi:hypothetical protein
VIANQDPGRRIDRERLVEWEVEQIAYCLGRGVTERIELVLFTTLYEERRGYDGRRLAPSTDIEHREQVAKRERTSERESKSVLPR